MNRHTSLLVILFSLLLLASCTNAGKSDVSAQQEEDKEAKAMLQGVWLDEEDGQLSFKVKGDTIIYADSTMAPVAFSIVEDSLMLHGYTEQHYSIVRQTPHSFQFVNGNGDIVKLIKSDNDGDDAVFDTQTAMTLNQNQLIKRDSVVFAGSHKYHVYIQVNPATYKVVRTTYNDDGVQVDNVYHDNIVNLCIYEGNKRLFSSDFHKQDFQKHVPASYLSQSILSDIHLDKATDKGLEFIAYVCVPDSPASYQIRIKISEEGRMTISMD